MKDISLFDFSGCARRRRAAEIFPKLSPAELREVRARIAAFVEPPAAAQLAELRRRLEEIELRQKLSLRSDCLKYIGEMALRHQAKVLA